MPGDPLKRFAAGEPFTPSAKTFNTFIDTANAVRGMSKLGGGSLTGASSGVIILIRNDSGADRDRFDVLAMTGLAITPSEGLESFQEAPTIAGTSPVVPDDLGKVAVLLEPIAAGQLGRAIVSGVTAVRLSADPGMLGYADFLNANMTQLGACASGPARILASGLVDSVWWAAVMLGGGGAGGGGAWISFTPNAAFSTSDAAFEATVKSVHGSVPDAAGEGTIPGDTVTINNGDGVQAKPFSGDTSTIGICANYDPVTDAYYCINLGCPPAGT